MVNKKTLKEKIKEIFAFEDQLDIYFPKGDKRRGEVLALLGIIHAKVSKVNKGFIARLKEYKTRLNPWGKSMILISERTFDELAGVVD